MKGGGGGGTPKSDPKDDDKKGGGLNPLGSPGGHGVFLGSRFKDPTWGPPLPGGIWGISGCFGGPCYPPPPPRPCGVPQPHFSPPFHPIKHQGTPKRHLGLGAFWGPLKAFWGLRSLLGGGGGLNPWGPQRLIWGTQNPKVRSERPNLGPQSPN